MNQFRFWLGASAAAAEAREARCERIDTPDYRWGVRGNVQRAFEELLEGVQLVVPSEGLFFVSQSKTGEPRTFMVKLGGRGKLHIKEHKD